MPNVKKPKEKYVWVALVYYDFEGFDQPVGIFTTYEAACKALARKADGKLRGDRRDVIRYTLNEKKTP